MNTKRSISQEIIDGLKLLKAEALGEITPLKRIHRKANKQPPKNEQNKVQNAVVTVKPTKPL